MEQSNNKGLRIGILMDSFYVPVWAYVILEKITKSEYASIELVILNNNAEKANRGLLSKIRWNRANLGYTAYRMLDDKLFKSKPDALEKKDTAHILANIPVVRVTPNQTKYSVWIEEQDIAKIRTYDIDVAIRLGFGKIIRGDILKIPKYGVWSYHHGDNTVHRGRPPAFWEVFEYRPTTGSILQVLTEDLDNGLVLDRQYSATVRQSVNRNRNSILWKSTLSLPRKLKELHELGEEQFFEQIKADNEHINFYSEHLYRPPGEKEFAKLLTKQILWYAKRALDSIFRFDQWILMFDLRDDISSSFWRFKAMIPPKGRCWADPHVVHKNGSYYIFVQEYVYEKRKAHISVITMNEKGNFTKAIKVLEEPYHLSYPFIFKWNKDLYMIPSSGTNSTLDIYRCVTFPHEWELHKTMPKNIKGADATLFFYQQKWWLFTYTTENNGIPTGDQLSLFYSTNPLSDNWISHPLNPIVTDVRRSRPAGGIIRHSGNIYRPAQDGSGEHGYGIRINQIVRLSETEYEEKEVAFIEPNWDRKLRRTHTINHANRLTIIDGMLRRW